MTATVVDDALRAETRLCHECSDRKPLDQFPQTGNVCLICHEPDDAPADITDKPRGVEQLERIRELSEIVYGHRGLAFKHHGMPSTRGEASDLIALLHETRHTRDEEAAAMQETRTCTSCKTEQPLIEFAKKGRGRSRTCKSCDDSASEAINPKPSGAAAPSGPGQTTGGGDGKAASLEPAPAAPPLPEPDPPLSTHVDGWSVFTDPRLSELRSLQAVLADQLEIDVIEITLEDAAKVATAIGATFGPKEDA